MAWDMGVIVALWKAYPLYVEGNWPLTFLWWNATGFMMWALFVVGHDCGHKTFSDYPLVNAVCGHLCHAPLLVPFWPWAQSHHQHHLYHNHIEKDKSFPWFKEEQYDACTTGFAKVVLKSPFHPLFSYGLSYLFLGYWDGSHFNPFGRMFRTDKERVQCAVSSLSVALFVGAMLHFVFEWNLQVAAFKYLPSYCIFNYWLVLVRQQLSSDARSFTRADGLPPSLPPSRRSRTCSITPPMPLPLMTATSTLQLRRWRQWIGRTAGVLTP
jgi:omega-3 fatty acid desaturase (delta-15 desaturase)